MKLKHIPTAVYLYLLMFLGLLQAIYESVCLSVKAVIWLDKFNKEIERKGKQNDNQRNKKN